ncbi:MAG: DMT family transporter [Bacteroidetes bacterium]|nr:DMT family transporter [Bacteroidota bacterium]
MTTTDRSLQGGLFVLLAAFSWGISGTAAQFLFSRNIQVMQVVQTRSTFAFLFFLLILALFRRSSLKPDFKKTGWFLAAGIIGVGFSNFTYYYTISVSSVGTAIILQYTAPVIVMVYGILSKDEAASWMKWLALSVSLAGCILAVGAGSTDLFDAGPLAVAIGVASAFCFAAMGIIGRRLNRHKESDLWQNLVFTMMAAALFWAVLRPPVLWPSWNLTPAEWGTLGLFSLISVVVPYLFFYLGLRFLPPSTVLIISTFEPITAIASAWIVLGETMSAIQIAGASLVILAILILALENRVTLRRMR